MITLLVTSSRRKYGARMVWRRILTACLLFTAPLVVRASEIGTERTWAWQTPQRPALPTVKNAAWTRNPIDVFILQKLEAEGLTPAAEADRQVLIRRLSFDLTGLPPTPAEVHAFVRDAAPDAYERLVERLLASPRYGERWAMYWLDLARFAESDGFKADDIRPTAWRYRDYVIQSLNQDKPFDRFVREQIAGDELYPGDREALVATAFNRHFPDEYNARNLEQRRQEILNDMTDTTAQVFLGMTVGCARCHDHKYDPITQKDYYRLQAFFAGFWTRDDVVMNRPEEVAQHQEKERQWRERIAPVQKRLHELEEPLRAKMLAKEKAKFPREIQEAYDTPYERRTPYQRQLADLVSKQLVVKSDVIVKAMSPPVRKEWQDLTQKMTAIGEAPPGSLTTTMGITDIGPVAPATYLLQRGNWRHKGEEVAPGFFALLDNGRPAPVPTAPVNAATTGRRSVLAEWLLRPDNPLTARVMVNRLWQHHFGRGIVATPSDFGVIGQPPTHPELLDWLATEFVARGWSLKAMHRLMVTSATYRQSSRFRADAAQIDPDNDLLWRMNRRRLEGEALRDALLSVSGQLNLKAGGPSVFPELPAELNVPAAKWPVSADIRERQRRSVYVFVKRNLRYPLFDAFDAPDSNESCARRHVSTNAPQALMLLNSQITLDLAKALASRVLREADHPQRIIQQAYHLALGRDPTDREMTLASEFLSAGRGASPGLQSLQSVQSLQSATVDLCHVLLILNEFAYVD